MSTAGTQFFIWTGPSLSSCLSVYQRLHSAFLSISWGKQRNAALFLKHCANYLWTRKRAVKWWPLYLWNMSWSQGRAVRKWGHCVTSAWQMGNPNSLSLPPLSDFAETCQAHAACLRSIWLLLITLDNTIWGWSFCLFLLIAYATQRIHFIACWNDMLCACVSIVGSNRPGTENSQMSFIGLLTIFAFQLWSKM